MSTRRDNLHQIKDHQARHASLWLDKYLADQGEKSRSTLVAEVSSIAQPELYARFYERWERELSARQDTALRDATVRGRMIIGLGAESVIETGVTLHHTYGMPYIPGSALKGLAAAFARQHLDPAWLEPELSFDPSNKQAQPSPYEVLFGSTTIAGYVTFFDALYRPGSGAKGRALHTDVLTVHHPTYYNATAPEAPADWDDPIPVAFVSATGSYRCALAGPVAWVGVAYDILALALDEMGIGAKTSSGYGRMELEHLEQARARLGTLAVAVAPAQQNQKQPLAVGTELTGRCAKEVERRIFKGERIKAVRVTPNKPELLDLPTGVAVEFFATDGIIGGGIRAQIAAIDTSVPGVVSVLLTRVKKTSENG